ncbi:flavin-containing monooxygenase [Chthonobacter albigriseus]|uniref:flavin-containing monooxygenase n=1 Tax=Chthonobacter albigriseus TaxID=1683161 RepID=UPI0015EF85C4|nr:NAD(P)/FAD-dependent oxidoreductase [Chthonobacter albigriseus]
MTAPSDAETVRLFLERLERALNDRDPAAAAALFAERSFWRDLVAFTWTISTQEGRPAIAAMLASQLPTVAPVRFSAEGAPTRTDDGTVEAWFTFETRQARGRGHLRLKDGLGFTLLTAITELIGFEEKRGRTRPFGTVHGPVRGTTNWIQQKEAASAALGRTTQPYVVVVGGGQAGIVLGARLRQLGVPHVVVEKTARPGDTWRNRYDSLVLHDPIWYDHLPYIPFPDTFPVFTPKDQIADWLEMYAKVMEVEFWGSTECLKASYDAEAREWAVRVRRSGEEIVLRPQQLVFATGSYGPPKEIDLPGKALFEGLLYHSAHHKTAAGHAGKRVVVVGANTSAHDIAADFCEHGADVTMIQRSPTTVVRSETLLDVAFEGLYSENALARGITTDIADLTFASVPFRLMPEGQLKLYETIRPRDAALIARLEKAGFRTDYGEDGTGHMMKALRTGSGFYLDVGASELIARGDIKVRSGVEPTGLTARSVILSDGSEVAADVIVFATGFKPMNAWVADLVSQDAADLIGPNWGYGSGTKGDPGPWLGELRNMWKPLRHEALWFHGGNLHLNRFHSLHVALQLKARMEGLPTPVYG